MHVALGKQTTMGPAATGPSFHVDQTLCDELLANARNFLLPFLDDSAAVSDYGPDTPLLTPDNSGPPSPDILSPTPAGLSLSSAKNGTLASMGSGLSPRLFGSGGDLLSASALFEDILLGGLAGAGLVVDATGLEWKAHPPQLDDSGMLCGMPMTVTQQASLPLGTLSRISPAAQLTPGLPRPEGLGYAPLMQPAHSIVVPQRRFSPYAPRQLPLRKPVPAGETDAQETRERHNHVHNVLERKRRKDLNDTFDQLAAATSPGKTSAAKLCKREIINDAVEHIRYLKRRSANLILQKEGLGEENQRLAARLKRQRTTSVFQ